MTEHAIEVQRLCVKRWLSHIRAVHDEVAMCAMRIQEIREVVELTGVSYDDVGSGGSSAGDAIPRAVVRLLDLQEELDRRVDAYEDEYGWAIDLCCAEYVGRHAVWLHEVDRLCWDEVGKRIGYSQSQARRIADGGIRELYLLIPERYRRSPIPDALPEWAD